MATHTGQDPQTGNFRLVGRVCAAKTLGARHSRCPNQGLSDEAGNMNERDQVVGLIMVGLVAPLGVLLTVGTWFMFDRVAPEGAAPTTTTTTLPRLARARAATPGGLDGPIGTDNAYLPGGPRSTRGVGGQPTPRAG